jgi:hypothetical protein
MTPTQNVPSCGCSEQLRGPVRWSSPLHLSVAPAPAYPVQSGNDVFDLGEALYGFLLRYGEEFDYHSGAGRGAARTGRARQPWGATAA